MAAAAIASGAAGCKDDPNRAVIKLAAIDGRLGPSAAAPAAPRSAKDDLPAALAEVLGPHPGAPGRLFDGLVLGEAMPAAVGARIAGFERAHLAHVHYDVDAAHAATALTVRFDVATGLGAAVARRWGPPSDPWWSWRDPAGRWRASLALDGRGSDLVWTPMRTIDALVAPHDPGPLGLEPVPVGGSLADLQRALGDRLGRIDDRRWEWWSPGPAGNFAIDVTAVRGVITRLDADLPARTPAGAAAIVAALRAKYGPGTTRDDSTTWRRAGRAVTARTRGGTVSLTIVRAR